MIAVVLRGVKKPKGVMATEGQAEASQAHQIACEIAEQARATWNLDIVLVLLSEDKQFCSASVAPPIGMSRSQTDYIQAVAENAMDMGLIENALTFSLLRIQLTLTTSGKTVAVRKPTSRELIQAISNQEDFPVG